MLLILNPSPVSCRVHGLNLIISNNLLLTQATDNGRIMSGVFQPTHFVGDLFNS